MESSLNNRPEDSSDYPQHELCIRVSDTASGHPAHDVPTAEPSSPLTTAPSTANKTDDPSLDSAIDDNAVDEALYLSPSAAPDNAWDVQMDTSPAVTAPDDAWWDVTAPNDAWDVRMDTSPDDTAPDDAWGDVAAPNDAWDDQMHTSPDVPAPHDASGDVTAFDNAQDGEMEVTPAVPAPESRRSSGHSIECLIHINDRLLPGYPKETICRVGTGVQAGLTTSAKCMSGPYRLSSIAIGIAVRDGNDKILIQTLTVPLYKAHDAPRLQEIASDDLAALEPLYPTDYVDTTDLRNGTYPKGYHEQFGNLDDREAISAAAHMSSMTDRVVCWSVDIDMRDILVTLSDISTLQRRSSPVPSQAAIASGVSAFLEATTGVVHLRVSFPWSEHCRLQWEALVDDRLDPNPFAQLGHGLRTSSLDDLTYDNVNTDNLSRPDKSLDADMAFLSRDSRTAALIVAAVEELEMQDGFASAMWDSHVILKAVPDTFSAWTPEEDDLEKYGTRADGTYWRQYLIMDIKDQGAYLPDFEQSCIMFLQVPIGKRPVPNPGRLSAAQVSQVASGLINSLLLAQSAGERASDLCAIQLRQLQRKLERTNSDAAAERLQGQIRAKEEELPTVQGRTYQISAAKALYEFVPEQRDGQPLTPVARFTEAIALADTLRQADAEAAVAWRARVTGWVQEAGIVVALENITPWGHAFRAVRLPLPRGVRANVALFAAQTPTQSAWTKGFTKPPIAMAIPYQKPTGSIEHFLNHLFDSNAGSITGKIWWSPSDTTTKHECATVSTYNGMAEGSPGRAWWDYTLQFRDFDEAFTRDLHQAFPVLGQRFRDGAYGGEVGEAIACLQRTRAGHVLITGGPGAGKSALGRIISEAVIAGPVETGWVTVAPTGSDDAESSTSVDAATQPDDPDEPQWACPALEETDKTRTQRRADKAPEGILGSDHATTQYDDWQAPATDHPFEYAVPAGWGAVAADADRSQSHGGPPGPAEDADRDAGNGRVVWVAGTNSLVSDAAHRFVESGQARRVCRLFPWTLELHNLISSCQPPQPAYTEEGLAAARRQDQVLAVHSHYMQLQRFATTAPASHPNSLSELAWSTAQQEPEQWSLVLQARLDKETSPASFEANRNEYMEAARELLVATALSCDVICGTPVSVAQLANHTAQGGWRPDLIVVDEVGREHETSALIAPSKFPEAACIYIGDVRQFSPMSLARSEVRYRDIFGNQRATSLLHRASALGKLDFVLKSNHRAHGSVCNWPQEKIYTWTMSLANGKSDATAAWNQYLLEHVSSSIQTATVWLDAREGKEIKMGTSFSNETNCRIVMELAICLFRDSPIRNMKDFMSRREPMRRGSIMILVAYAQQKARYLSLLRDVCEAEVPVDLLTVRTIDESPSHEADIVIIDLVRTTKAGFINNLQRLSVMTTRARLGQFIIGNRDIADRGLLRSLYDWIKDRQAVVRVGGKHLQWDVWCDRCDRPGHNIYECSVSLHCGTCHAAQRPSSHNARRCPHVAPASGLLQDVIPALDPERPSIFHRGKADGQQGRKRTRVRKAKRAERQRGPEKRRATESAVVAAAAAQYQQLGADQEDAGDIVEDVEDAGFLVGDVEDAQ